MPKNAEKNITGGLRKQNKKVQKGIKRTVASLPIEEELMKEMQKSSKKYLARGCVKGSEEYDNELKEVLTIFPDTKKWKRKVLKEKSTRT